MGPGLFPTLLGILGVATGMAIGGCSKREAAPSPATEAEAPTPVGGGKIPVTTASAEAKAEFLQGRDKYEKSLDTDARAHFQKAISLDPNFAWAELALANASPTRGEFFDHLHKAVALADKASHGEKLLILANEAAATANPARQQAYLEQLAAAYPNDERAHFYLAGYYFGQQDFNPAIEHYKKATELAPSYSNAYNLLGYAYRQSGDYASSEKAFQKYIELLPGDPNPYDSYAELLLKMGRFDDSIVQYRKALEIDPNFLNAYQGLSMDLLYSGKPGEAEKELAKSLKAARSAGETRQTLFARTIVHVDEGQASKALSDLDEQYALGEKTKDVPAMAFDRGLKGLLYAEGGKADAAKKEYDAALELVQGSDLPQQVKDNQKLVYHSDMSRVALARKDFVGARKEADLFRQGAEGSKNPATVRNAHELDGTIALAERDYDRAIAELLQADQQNPQDLYRLCEAYGGKGDTAKAGEFCKKAADFNSIPDVNYALVRTKAKAWGQS
ncbi:MAG TPA: tetratricopeptide repeat protein [Thermoanaerobaculia bacterium]|nr:tetratricopeptide repeat protein [Thermoanaerobaculia bacterium]